MNFFRQTWAAVGSRIVWWWKRVHRVVIAYALARVRLSRREAFTKAKTFWNEPKRPPKFGDNR